MSIKIERIESSMVKEISYLLANEIKDPDIHFVTVTAAKVTNDLSFAKIYVTVFDEEKKKSTLDALNNASDTSISEVLNKSCELFINNMNSVLNILGGHNE